MKIIDLSHPLVPSMPVYPGTEPPEFTDVYTYGTDGFLEKKITFYSHAGTHLDAPAHLFPGGKTLDAYPVDQFAGPAVVLRLTGTEGRIAVADLLPYEEELSRAAYVLLYTGWSHKWGSPAYFSSYPVLSPAAAGWLARFPLRGIGTDTPSLDAVGARGLPVHNIFLAKEILIVENLTRLDRIDGGRPLFCCFPLKMEGAEGSPVRAVAIID